MTSQAPAGGSPGHGRTVVPAQIATPRPGTLRAMHPVRTSARFRHPVGVDTIEPSTNTSRPSSVPSWRAVARSDGRTRAGMVCASDGAGRRADGRDLRGSDGDRRGRRGRSCDLGLGGRRELGQRDGGADHERDRGERDDPATAPAARSAQRGGRHVQRLARRLEPGSRIVPLPAGHAGEHRSRRHACLASPRSSGQDERVRPDGLGQLEHDGAEDPDRGAVPGRRSASPGHAVLPASIGSIVTIVRSSHAPRSRSAAPRRHDPGPRGWSCRWRRH